MLKEILSIQSESYNQFRMFSYLIRRLSVIEDTDVYVDKGNIYVTKGYASTYPCIVAHMDTVHDIVEDLTPIEIGGKITGFNRVTMEQVGIGGDDKVGIYIALRCLDMFDNIKVAFFRDEEVGCHGSYEADDSFFNDCMYVLQCDRRGNSDFIVNGAGVDLSSQAFRDAVAPLLFGYGYSEAHGSITDVVALTEIGIGVSVANISCGYYNPHMPNEYVDVADVENCLNLVVAIISTLTDVYPHNLPAPKHDPYKWWDSDYCQDCWSAPAQTEERLCKTCYSYYKSGVLKDTDLKEYSW